MKALKTKLRLKKNEYDRVIELSIVSKNLYNQANYLVKQYFKYTGSYLNYNEMDLIMKERINLDGNINYQLLKSGVSQQILKKLDKNWVSFFKLIKDWKKTPKKYKGMPRPPHYIKEDKYNLIYDYQRFQVKDKQIRLEKGLMINIPKQLKDRTIKQIEIIPRIDFFNVVFVYVDDEKYIQIEKNSNVIGIDLGLNNVVTAVSNVIKPFIINGKPLKSINQYANKQLSKKQTCL
jgi:putative transposase